MIYNNNLAKLYDDMGTKDIGEAVADSYADDTETASSQIGKGVDELESELKTVSAENEEAKPVSTPEPQDQKQEQKATSNANTKKEDVKKETAKKTEDNSKKNEDKKEEKKEEPAKTVDPVFDKPVEGTLMKEYAKDKLVYSETLKEWVVHTGVDIKADKTTVVKAAENGKVVSIKNDPRYGTTVIIEHTNGYETRYANLLTAEFVNIGDEVIKGQTIGTVGNTATFEIMDDFHLHFEILKEGEYQDPALFIAM